MGCDPLTTVRRTRKQVCPGGFVACGALMNRKALLPMVAPVAVPGIVNLFMHLEADGVAVPSVLGWRL
jgi:hypothetical protein